MTQPVIVWFRNDLRLADHPALAAAAATGPILPLYILDDTTPGRWRMGGASRWWLHGSLAALSNALKQKGGTLILRQDEAPKVLAALLDETKAAAIHVTRGYEPWEPELKAAVASLCKQREVTFQTFSGRLLFEPEAIVTGDGHPYRVFTPFWKACLAASAPRAPLPVPKSMQFADASTDTLASLCLLPTHPDWAGGLRDTWQTGESVAHARLHSFIDDHLAGYADNRSRLDLDATSRLSPHLHFGEVSPNQVWHAVTSAAAKADGKIDCGAHAYLREIGWREFSYHLLAANPGLPSKPIRPEFADFPWAKDEKALTAWRKGLTGYPIVDAAIRELWHTGFMPNRARMIVASYLVKHLLIPWQTGAGWFLDTLVDADLANNSASWQWVAGCGADAAPFFRIFNPMLQGAKFDPTGDYVRRWVPELRKLEGSNIHAPWDVAPLALKAAGVVLGDTYPEPIVDHQAARFRALSAFDTIRRS